MASREQIVVTQQQTKPSKLWMPVVLTSVAAHFLLFLCTHELVGSQKERYGTSRVTLRVVTKRTATAPPPVPQIQPSPEPPPETRKRRVVRRRRPRATPKPNASPDSPPPASSAPRRPVFGVTADSVTGAGTGPAVRQGNTLEKKMEHKPTLPSWVTPLPAAPPAPEPPKPKTRPYPLHKLTRAPGFRRKVEPVYPAKARARESQGTVLLRITIDEKGKVCGVGVLRSPDPALARAAVIAVRRSVMTPGYIGHKAVPVVIKIPYTFVLEG